MRRKALINKLTRERDRWAAAGDKLAAPVPGMVERLQAIVDDPTTSAAVRERCQRAINDANDTLAGLAEATAYRDSQ